MVSITVLQIDYIQVTHYDKAKNCCEKGDLILCNYILVWFGHRLWLHAPTDHEGQLQTSDLSASKIVQCWMH